jgi:hypothetical protein
LLARSAFWFFGGTTCIRVAAEVQLGFLEFDFALAELDLELVDLSNAGALLVLDRDLHAGSVVPKSSLWI